MESLFRGNPDERPVSLEVKGQLISYILNFTPDERPHLLKGNF